MTIQPSWRVSCRGIWKFADDEPFQDQVRDGERYVTGTRNVVALAWNPWADKLFFVNHGRDTLGREHVVSVAQRPNVASIRIMQRLGMQLRETFAHR